MEQLRLALLEKLSDPSQTKSVFEVVARDADDETVFKAQSKLYETLLKCHLDSKVASKNSSIFFGPKYLTRMNDMSSVMQWGTQDRSRSELFMRREVEYMYLRQINPDILFEKLYQNSEVCAPTKLPQVQVLDRAISFDGYQKVVQELNYYLIVRQWLSPKLFMKLLGNESDGRVLIIHIMDYVSKKLDNYQFRLELFPYDDNGRGYMTKEKLTIYFGHKLDMDNRCWTTPDGKSYPLNKFYINHIVSEIFFILDPLRTKRLRIVGLLDSRMLPNVRQSYSERPMYSRFMRKMTAFVAMDVSGTELIPVSLFCDIINNLCRMFPEISEEIWGQDEKKRFLLPFLENLIHIYGSPSDNGHISFETFLDITFACENLGVNLASIHYFFRVLDVDRKGYLDEIDIQSHYRNICATNPNTSAESFVTFTNLQSQIGDMLAKDGGLNHVTPSKLHGIRGGHTLIEYLIDAEASVENHGGEYSAPSDVQPVLVPTQLSSTSLMSESPTTRSEVRIDINISDANHENACSHPHLILKDQGGQGDGPSSASPIVSVAPFAPT